MLGPLLVRGGFVLVGDMVFVPDQPWKQAWTGGDEGVPRAVPSDAWVALVDNVVPGEWLQKCLLLVIVLGAALGMAQLLRDLPFGGRAAGAVLYVWNPYVYERLAIGHWALLCGYAALPWAVSSVLRLRHEGIGRPGRAFAGLALALACAAWSSPTGGLVVLVSVLVLSVGRHRLFGVVVLLGAWVNLPWLVPALVNHADALEADPFGVVAFGARADTPFGVLGSLATFGGIWKTSIVPDDRQHAWLAALLVLVVIAGLVGLGRLRSVSSVPLPHAVALAVGSLVAAALPASDLTRPMVEWLVVHAPGGGLARDSQKLLMPWVLVVSLGFGLAVSQLATLERQVGRHARVWMVLPVVLPLVALPTMALGLGGFLKADPYPSGWEALRAELETAGVAGERVVVLPPSTYRRFAWTPRSVLDPVPRYFPGHMVTDDSLQVRGGRVQGESSLAREVRLAEDPDVLAEVLSTARISWVVVHDDPEPVLLPTGAREVVRGDGLAWYRTTSPLQRLPAWPGRAQLFAALELAVLAGTAACLVIALARGRVRRMS
ncbi:hypothetical protein [Nocardioides houyundeii]|uniref:hypothetical protein n=1 Tax=Nocardioides houyundeii TaxID=2045452 RepID=UPI0013B3B7DA|nr:hypothetical protein [Nocardioides houyundeii]